MCLIEKGTDDCCRSMQARLAMRVLPRMSFGLEYSKGMRWAQYSGGYIELTAEENDDFNKRFCLCHILPFVTVTCS